MNDVKNRGPVDGLEAALVIIDDPLRWTSEALAVRADGVPVAANRPEAVAFGLAGALLHVYGHASPWDPHGTNFDRAYDALDRASERVTGKSSMIATHGLTQEAARLIYASAIDWARTKFGQSKLL